MFKKKRAGFPWGLKAIAWDIAVSHESQIHDRRRQKKKRNPSKKKTREHVPELACSAKQSRLCSQEVVSTSCLEPGGCRGLS